MERMTEYSLNATAIRSGTAVRGRIYSPPGSAKNSRKILNAAHYYKMLFFKRLSFSTNFFPVFHGSPGQEYLLDDSPCQECPHDIGGGKYLSFSKNPAWAHASLTREEIRKT